MITTDPHISAYIDALPAWQGEYARRVRELIHQAASDVEETIKRTSWPFFLNASRNIAAFQSAKDHLNILIYDPLAPDPHGLINQGHGNATARAIQIREGDSLNEAAFVELIRAVAANNRAGGWRKLKDVASL